jgi:hypothetical protein
MFFYGEQDIALEPVVIANRLATNNMPSGQSLILDLSGAANNDLLVVYSHRYSVNPFKNQYNIVSSSAGSNWYSLADSKYGSVEFYRGGTYLTYYINCSNQNVGSISTTYSGETSVVMKKLTAAELSGQVAVSCYPGGSISYMLIRNVNAFDMHRNASNVTLTSALNPNWGSTTVNWQITNTNITASTKKLFICALRGGSTIDISGVPNISQNKETTSRLFQINNEQLTGSSIPIVCGRTLQQTNAGAAYAAFIGMVIS